MYLEYVAELAKVPTLDLHDEVVLSPRPALPADFRRGQRPNARKEARDDPYRVREGWASDLEELYTEYAGGAVASSKKRRRAQSAKPPARKRAATGRKRRKS